MEGFSNSKAAPFRRETQNVTVLTCDIEGSTSLCSISRDEWADARREFRRYCSEVAGAREPFYGFKRTMQCTADEVRMLFGEPGDFDDSQIWAVEVALRLLAGRQSLQDRIAQNMQFNQEEVQINFRIGIDYGPCTIDLSDDGEDDFDRVTGDPQNAVDRLQKLANTNEVMISENLYKLVKHAFVCEARGKEILKGFASPIDVYRVLSRSEFVSRIDAVQDSELTKFIGREGQLSRLMKIAAEARKADGKMVFLGGEAGIGKSRLVREFDNSGALESWQKVNCYCSEIYKGIDFYPIIMLLKRLFGIRSGDSDMERVDKIQQRLTALSCESDEFSNLLIGLFDKGFQHVTHTASKDSDLAISALHSLILNFLSKLSANRPLRLLIEDMHWMDQASKAFCDRLAASIGRMNLVTLITFRQGELPDYLTPLPPAGASVVHENLEKLDEVSVGRMIDSICGDDSISPESREFIFSKGANTPFFIEELTAGALRRNGIIADFEIGSNDAQLLEAMLAGRLKQIGESRQLAKLAAAIGRSFDIQLLKALVASRGGPHSSDSINRHLERMVDGGLINTVNQDHFEKFVFRHDLLRDAAYAQIPQAERLSIHQLIAKSARRLKKYQIAVGHLEQSLQIARRMREGNDRSKTKLEIELNLGSLRIELSGYADKAVAEHYNNALEHALRLNDDPRTMKARAGIETYQIMRADFQNAQEAIDQCRTLADKLGDTVNQMRLNWMQGQLEVHRGWHESAHGYLQRCCGIYEQELAKAADQTEQIKGPRMAMQDFCVMSHCYLSWSYWFIGLPDKSLDSAQKALDLSEMLSTPFNEAIANAFFAGLSLFRGDVSIAEEHAAVAIRLSEEYGFRDWLGLSHAIKGRAIVGQGKLAEGIEQIKLGSLIWEGTGAQITRPYFWTLLTESNIIAGNIKQARSDIERAEEILAITQEGYFEAEVYRIKALIAALETDDSGTSQDCAEALQYLERARSVATDQGAYSLLLRTEMQEFEFRQQTEPHSSNRSSLESIYQKIDGGGETLDLRRAKSLLGISSG